MGCRLEYPVLGPLFLQASGEAPEFRWATEEALIDETVQEDKAHKPSGSRRLGNARN